jgi:hypothetical protein
MKSAQFRPLAEMAVAAIVFWLLHEGLLFILNKQQNLFLYSLAQLYAAFLMFALVLFAVLVVVKQHSIDNVGNIFILLTCLQLGGAYLLLRTILDSAAAAATFEKINVFAVFAIFLATETVVAVRLLNKK